jgi:hypothetical protein
MPPDQGAWTSSGGEAISYIGLNQFVDDDTSDDSKQANYYSHHIERYRQGHPQL